ncbi:GvpL/GvpF family gas vesicle protein [Frankia sp. CNm7]|uniref:GvpL/GvpF family gas vesicle protein n=2 Tax=Frankia nepalensis TaxID=1836974 RepID=A0A937RBA0_9ACTN|nr:GvpL/GvpF family gas vesicle protein [Frankia nepalensis]MBL7496599.1 GvpL/GvpF family gas vesicle protein [Frankia nepalensis]MBL7513342.1 GvpL/GvpF family gas vesicle protein [Frankia nepalensis]MBL7521601.1 GvpL/GvpF family gas vesicle protein [Frankia nepalensis]MBL7626607.1 GvpL/GvpF family gas vesicle protein [Frankia nepalensis]
MAPLFLYGVVRDDHPPPDPASLGVGDPPGRIQLVRHGPVAAVVSPVADAIRVADRDAERHLDVLLELFDAGPVIPLRLGSVAPDEDAVREEVLGEAAPELRRRLDALEGFVEVHVDADESEMSAIRAVIAADPSLAAARDRSGDADLSNRVALGERVADGVVLRRLHQAEILLEELRPCAVADTGRWAMGGPEDPVLRWAFLVHRDAGPGHLDLEQFDQAVERVRHGHPELVIGYVGPLPVFHFLELVEPDEPAGAASEPSRGRWGW